MYLSRRVRRKTGERNQNNEHEHRSYNPMIERCRQRSVLHEHQPGLEADLREKPYRTQIQNYTTAQWEDNQLDNDKGGDLFQLLVSLI